MASCFPFMRVKCSVMLQARRALLRAVHLNPTDMQLRFNVGLVLQVSSKLEQSQRFHIFRWEQLFRVVRLNPAGMQLRSDVALVLQVSSKQQSDLFRVLQGL